MPQAQGTLSNCVKLTRETVVMFFDNENTAAWVIEAMQQRMRRQEIDPNMWEWKLEPWFIEGEF